MTIKPTTSATAEPEQPAITTSQYLQETVENRRTERRGVLAAGLTLVGAAIAWFAGRANAGHDTNIAYDSQTTMHLDVLRCKTVAGVMKELAIYLVVYNLIRLVMLGAAAAQRVDVRRVSFIDAMRLVAARMIGLDGVERLIVNPDRTGRRQLRMIRSRPKAYDWLRVTRRQKEAEIARKQAEVR